jgi:hypothetical protein
MDSALIDRTSEQFLGQWKQLVSTTNWQKGQIIHDWREAMRASGVPGSEWSDEAWSRRVGNVTAQHVGRLRRAFERFAPTRDSYPGLYWSHFQAALDWDDADMWLEGAVQSGWSISEMRQKRWETIGSLAGDGPRQDEAASEPWDEDADASDDVVSGTLGVVRAPHEGGEYAGEGSDEVGGSDGSEFDDDQGVSDNAVHETATKAARAEIIRPFANLPSLPADVRDAFEAYKLCILRHKLAGWQEISKSDMLLSLDALKQLAVAPADAN